MQLLKQSRGNSTASSALAWELFFLVASAMPPSKDFVGLVSEYVHTVAHGDLEVDAASRALAQRTWTALKRSAKAGTRRTVRAQQSQPPLRALPGWRALHGGRQAWTLWGAASVTSRPTLTSTRALLLPARMPGRRCTVTQE